VRYAKNTGEIIIFLKYNNNKPTLQIFNLFKSSNILYVTYPELNKMTKKKNKLFLISTSHGILSNVDALSQKIGGIIIAEIRN